MYRKDYLQRQFEEFGKVLAVILGYKGKGDWDKFEQSLNEAAEKLTDLHLPSVEAAGMEETMTMLSDNRYTASQLKILGTLLFEKLNYYSVTGQEKEFGLCGQKALLIYRHLQQNQTGAEFDLDILYKLNALASLGFS